MIRLLAVLALVASVGIAQTPPAGPTPRDLYHQGAKLFVDGDDAAALEAVDAGLARAPDDARLQALRDLIQQDQDPNEDQSQDPQEGESDPDGQDEQDDGDQGESTSDPEGGPEAERDATDATPDDPSAGQTQPRSGEPAEMTPAQAERLLDAVGGEERLLLREMRRPPTQRRRSDKDW